MPGMDEDALLEALSRLEKVTSELRTEGEVVRYLGSTVILDEEACFSEFAASSEDVVRRANERAAVPFARIHRAISVPAADTLREAR